MIVPAVFQLTASRRGWQYTDLDAKVAEYISTHSLTKRLTQFQRITLLNYIYFNSQPHEEADVHGFVAADQLCGISTHSLTKRLTKNWDKIKEAATFQLTASRRGWQRKKFICSEKVVFQLTASRRGWPRYIESCSGYFYFNSQPHEEADKKSNAYLDDFKKFQLTASRRGWRTDKASLHH